MICMFRVGLLLELDLLIDIPICLWFGFFHSYLHGSVLTVEKATIHSVVCSNRDWVCDSNHFSIPAEIKYE